MAMKEKVINASEIKSKEDWQKAVKSGARIVFDGGVPLAPKAGKRRAKK